MAWMGVGMIGRAAATWGNKVVSEVVIFSVIGIILRLPGGGCLARVMEAQADLPGLSNFAVADTTTRAPAGVCVPAALACQDAHCPVRFAVLFSGRPLRL